MVNTVYNLDSAWSGFAQDSKWIYVDEDDGTVTLEQFEVENDIKVKIQVTTTQLADEFSTHTWQWAPGGGETAHYIDKDGAVQSVDGASVTAGMLALGNYFKSADDATAAAKLVTTTLLNYHDTLEY